MTYNQRLFADEYIRNGRNATKAYMVAYPKIKKDQTAAACAAKLLRNAKVLDYIQTRIDETSNAAIADAQEIMAYFTRVMRGEDETARTCDRNTAAEKLAKMLGVDNGLERERFDATKQAADNGFDKLDQLIAGITEAAEKDNAAKH